MHEYTEWRLIARAPDLGLTTALLIDEVRANVPEDVDVHERGRSEILVYAFDESDIRAAEAELRRVFAREAIPVETTLTRWNPGNERWQDPVLPIEPPRKPIAPEWVDLGELAYELRIKFQSVAERRALERQLRQEGRPHTSDGWKGLIVGVANETEAQQLAEELRPQVPLAEMRVRPLSRFRRWLIRQAVRGNYGSGVGGWGDGGGNGGGG